MADRDEPVEPTAIALRRALRDTGALWLFTCPACGRAHHPPRALCPHCGATGSAPRPVDPAGRVHSWTTIHRVGARPSQQRTPYTVVLVELARGVRILANAPGDRAPAIGDLVTVTVRPEGEDDVSLWLA